MHDPHGASVFYWAASSAWAWARARARAWHLRGICELKQQQQQSYGHSRVDHSIRSLYTRMWMGYPFSVFPVPSPSSYQRIA